MGVIRAERQAAEPIEESRANLVLWLGLRGAADVIGYLGLLCDVQLIKALFKATETLGIDPSKATTDEFTIFFMSRVRSADPFVDEFGRTDFGGGRAVCVLRKN